MGSVGVDHSRLEKDKVGMDAFKGLRIAKAWKAGSLGHKVVVLLINQKFSLALPPNHYNKHSNLYNSLK